MKHLIIINQQCVTCLKSNPQGALCNSHPSHQLRRHQPGEDWQIDFTHMPKHKKFKYLLTLVDTFSGWIEAYPTTGETANIVASILTEHIIPRFGLPLTLQSDNGPAFISKVVQQVAALLHITWKLHIPYRPQSSGKVEKANGLIKQQFIKLSLETRQSWVTLLPLALTWLRAAPRSPTGLSPFKLVYGRPLTLEQLPTLSSPLANYLPYLTLLRQLLRQHAELAHLPPTGTYNPHTFLSPGDQVYLKNIQAKDLQPRWKGPYTVLLSTHTAAKLLGLTHWVHISQLKRAPAESDKWESTKLTPTRLRLTKLP
nr:protein NYNRIN-like [Chlorocebus sabaeus]